MSDAGVHVADIFVSYTSSDREQALWIARELEALGHTPHVHEWEVKGGEDIYAWMQRRHDAADHVLCPARVTADSLATLGRADEAAALWARYGLPPGSPA